MGCPACGKERVDDAVGMVAVATGFSAFEVKELAACGGAGAERRKEEPCRASTFISAGRSVENKCVCVCVFARERH